MASLPPKKRAFWNNDVVTEIALHLPVQSLLRCRAVCKMWRDVIDSPFFRKLHTHTRTHIRSRSSYKEEDEDEDDTVYLHLNYDNLDDKVSIKGKSLNLNLEGFPSPMAMVMGSGDSWMPITSVKGLICFNERIWRPKRNQLIAICNPFLGQIRILPFSPILTSSSCLIFSREVGIGCDGEFYKVVELVRCLEHCHQVRHHAHLYSRRTDSWRALGGLDQALALGGLDQALDILKPIELSCNDGRFVHWYARSPSGWIVLTFDMKNEVFRTTTHPDLGSIFWSECELEWIVARDDGCSFILIISPSHRRDNLVRIYESSIGDEENGTSKLSWNHVVDLEEPDMLPTPTHLPLWQRDCVMLKVVGDCYAKRVLFYDYVARRFMGCFELPAHSDFFDYKGTFISP